MNFYNHHIESNTISLTFELRGSLGIPRQARSALKIFALGAGLGIPSKSCSSKVRLIVLLSNRMASGIHAHRFSKGVPTYYAIIYSNCIEK